MGKTTHDALLFLTVNLALAAGTILEGKVVPHFHITTTLLAHFLGLTRNIVRSLTIRTKQLLFLVFRSKWKFFILS